MTLNSALPEVATGNEKLAALSKVDFAARWSVSPRTASNWLAQGLPHLKLSERQVRIPVAEADQWLRSHFLTQRRAA